MDSKRLEGRDEPILDPDLPIIDSHHHLFDLNSTCPLVGSRRSANFHFPFYFNLFLMAIRLLEDLGRCPVAEAFAGR